MALLQMSYLSRALHRTVPVQVILPCDKIDDEREEYCMREGEVFPTLYLLHGLIGNFTDWVSGTRIQRWAEERNLAVVMPSGDNAFYIEGMTPYSDYGEFVGKELVDVTRNMFPLSRRREDTFIAGLSMGGFGAIRNGIRYSGTFSRVAAYSAAMHVFEEPGKPIAGEERNPAFREYLAAAAKTDRNPRVALADLLREGRPLPAFYLSCGTEDSLLPWSRLYRDLLRGAGAEVTYEEEPGAHEWDFWDRQIRKTLDWLPLGAADSGMGSGNVRT